MYITVLEAFNTYEMWRTTNEMGDSENNNTAGSDKLSACGRPQDKHNEVGSHILRFDNKCSRTLYEFLTESIIEYTHARTLVRDRTYKL